MSSNSGDRRSLHSGADTQQSSNTWSESALQLEMKLTAHPRTTNLAHIQELINLYDDKIRNLEDRMPHYPGGMSILQEAVLYHEITDIRYKGSVRFGYKLKEISRKQSLERISRLKNRKRRLEEAYRSRCEHVVFHNKMNAIIQDYTKFTL